MECYLATAHSDAWLLLCALAGTAVLDRWRSPLANAIEITLLVASFWMKQYGALFVLGGLAYLMLRDGALRAWPSWLVAVLLGPVLYLVAGARLFGPFLDIGAMNALFARGDGKGLIRRIPAPKGATARRPPPQR